jgi:hypothetical protein
MQQFQANRHDNGRNEPCSRTSRQGTYTPPLLPRDAYSSPSDFPIEQNARIESLWFVSHLSCSGSISCFYKQNGTEAGKKNNRQTNRK